MAKYRFLFADLRTGVVRDEFPFGDVAFSRELGAVGSGGFSASLPLSVKKPITAGRSYRSTVLADVPRAYYRLGEFSGTVATDMSVNALDATYSGTFTLAQAGALANDTNRSVSLGTDAGWVNMPTAAFVPTNRDFTFEAWVKLTGAATIYREMESNAAQKMVTVDVDASGFLRAGTNTAGRVTSTASAVTFNVWHHLVVTYNFAAQTMAFYVDGVSVPVNSAAQVPYTGASMVGGGGIGAIPASTPDFAGLIDEVAFYYSELSAERVLAHYRSGLGFPEEVTVELELMTAGNVDPGRTSVLIERDGVMVWGGILWAVNVDSNEETVKVGGQGFVSYYARRFIRQNIILVATEQFTIAQAVIDQVQAESGGNLGITVVKNPAAGSGVLRDRTYYGFERKQALEALQQLSEVQNGFDFELVVAGTVDAVVKQVVLSYPQQGIATDFVWEVGKDVQLLTYQSDAAQMANRVTVLGEGEGTLLKYVEQADTVSLATAPLLDRVEQQKDVKNKTTLTDHATAYLNRYKRGERTAQVRLLDAQDSPLGAYIPGDQVRLRASRGLLQVDEPWRIMGYTVQLDNENNETVDVDLAPLEAFGV